jgi:hypothetical protein
MTHDNETHSVLVGYNGQVSEMNRRDLMAGG